jgi:hypothetical protein
LGAFAVAAAFTLCLTWALGVGAGIIEGNGDSSPPDAGCCWATGLCLAVVQAVTQLGTPLGLAAWAPASTGLAGAGARAGGSGLASFVLPDDARVWLAGSGLELALPPDSFMPKIALPPYSTAPTTISAAITVYIRYLMRVG